MNISQELIRVAQLLTGKVLDVQRVKAFRKDFITLMKNVKIVSSYEQATEWKHHFNIWHERFEEFIFTHLLGDLKNMKFRGDITDSQAEYWDDKIRSDLWDFTTEARVPMFLTDDYWSEESRYRQYQQEVGKWERRVRRRSRRAWTTLQEFVKWYQSERSEEMNVLEPVEFTYQIAGRNVLLRLLPDSRVDAKDAIKKLTKAFRIYDSRVGSVPGLSKVKMPIVVDLTLRGIDKGGEYKRGELWLYAIAFSDNPKGLAKVIAHEYCHRLWHMIGSKSQDIWVGFVRGNLGVLDLSEVLRDYGNEQFLWDNNKIKRKDPILYLKIQQLYDMPSTRQFKNMLTMEQLREYIGRTNESNVWVNASPISGYAGKNPEEAFCEAMSLWCVYGNRAVLPEVRAILEQIV